MNRNSLTNPAKTSSMHVDPSSRLSLKNISIFPYGVARNRMEQTAKKLGVPAVLVRDLRQADVLITLKSYYRKHQKPIVLAEEKGVPIYVLRSNSTTQIERAFVELFNLKESTGNPGNPINLEDVSAQTMEAIGAVRNGQRWVDLPPAPARVRRIQHELVRQAELVSHSYGKEPNRHVRIFRE